MSRHRSNRRYEVLEFIKQDPRISIRELCEATGIRSTSGIWRYLHELELEGEITRKPGARGIFIGERPWGSPKGAKIEGPKKKGGAQISERHQMVLEVVQSHPQATMDELVKLTKIYNKSGLWYHLNKIAKRGDWDGIDAFLARLRAESKSSKINSMKARMARKTSPKHLNEMQRIEQVVMKAGCEIHEDAELRVMANGVKVITRKPVQTWTSLV